MPDIKQEWLKSLKTYSAQQIGKALSRVKEVYPKKPPNLEQFKALVHSLKNGKAGYQSFNLWKSEDELEENKANLDIGQTYLNQIRNSGL